MEKLTKIERLEQLRKELKTWGELNINDFRDNTLIPSLKENCYNGGGSQFRLNYFIVLDEDGIEIHGGFTNGTSLMAEYYGTCDTLATFQDNREIETLYDSNNILCELDVIGREKLEEEIKDSYFYDEEEDEEKTLEELVDEYSYDFNFDEFMRNNFESDYNDILDNYISNDVEYISESIVEDMERTIEYLKQEIKDIEQEIA